MEGRKKEVRSERRDVNGEAEEKQEIGKGIQGEREREWKCGGKEEWERGIYTEKGENIQC